MLIIKEKIKKLGGLYSLEKQLGRLYTAIEIETFLNKYNLKVNDDIVIFIKNFGGNAFKNDIVLTSQNKIPIADSSGQILLENFLAFNQGSFGILEAIDLIGEYIPNDCVPIMSKINGDYILYNTKVKNILYWHHESPEDKDLYEVSRNFEDWFLSFELKIKNDSDNHEITDFWIADDL